MTSDITVVIPTSPIKSHPDTAILEETVASVRHHLPDSEIVLTFDGVQRLHQGKRNDYAEYTRRALWLADHQWGHVCPAVYDRHLHQSGMMTAALISYIETPLILYVEHDAPLVTDRDIDWESCVRAVKSGTSNVLRFHHEGIIPADHQHLMFGQEQGWLLQTSQWSQRPHLSSTAFYRRIMNQHFDSRSPVFIEDVMHSVVQTAVDLDGMMGWRQYRLHVYAPEDSYRASCPGRGNLKYSYHLDGRRR